MLRRGHGDTSTAEPPSPQTTVTTDTTVTTVTDATAYWDGGDDAVSPHSKARRWVRISRLLPEPSATSVTAAQRISATQATRLTGPSGAVAVVRPPSQEV
jgi:hypothetical protein